MTAYGHQPMLRKVDCLALPVPDLDAALSFYQSLGHRVIWRTSTAVGLGLSDSDAELVLQTERANPEERGLYPAMTVGDELVYLGRLHGMSTRWYMARPPMS